LFGPIPDNTEGFIKKVQVDYYSDTDTKNASRQLRYVAEPSAIKDYNSDNTTSLAHYIYETKFIVKLKDGWKYGRICSIICKASSLY